jgi:hypothetical protein
MSPILGIVLSFLSGYISLSIEILWIRLMGIHSHGDPKGFSYTLGFFFNWYDHRSPFLSEKLSKGS